MKQIYPLTIVKDRYGGSYSEGWFLAFNLDPDEVPTEIHSDDMTCMDFWNDFNGIVGKGNTPGEAHLDLSKKLGD